MSEEKSFPIVKCEEFSSALHFCNLANTGNRELPTWIMCGKSSFLITKENIHDVSLGVLMAAEWKAKDE